MKISEARKISIIGGPGTGKSTLADNLGRELNIPVYHIDGINYLENWQQRDKEERDGIIREIIKKEKWITDGTYRTTLEERVKSSDIVIFLDYSNLARLKGTMTRYIKNNGKEKKEIPGCKEQMNLTFFRFVINWKKTKGYMINDVLNRNSNKKIIIFKNRRNLNKWYIEQFGKKILLTKSE